MGRSDRIPEVCSRTFQQQGGQAAVAGAAGGEKLLHLSLVPGFPVACSGHKAEDGWKPAGFSQAPPPANIWSRTSALAFVARPRAGLAPICRRPRARPICAPSRRPPSPVPTGRAREGPAAPSAAGGCQGAAGARRSGFPAQECLSGGGWGGTRPKQNPIRPKIPGQGCWDRTPQGPGCQPARCQLPSAPCHGELSGLHLESPDWPGRPSHNDLISPFFFLSLF